MLPWEYGVRNLARRPARTALTLLALTIVVVLVFVVIGFIRGLEKSLSISGDPDVVLVYSLTSEQNVENSSIEARIPDLLQASLDASVRRFGIDHVSPEMVMASKVTTENESSGFGLVRGVTQISPSVRRSVRLIEGTWPGQNEVLIGRLAITKLGAHKEQVAIGRTVEFEGQRWKISGVFSADGAAFESEIWCRLEDFQLATKRQDLSLVAMLVANSSQKSAIDLFCKERIDLELASIPERTYFANLNEFYKPVRTVAWTIVVLVTAAGVFAGLNMMYGAVAGRVREFATLQAIGYRRRAILLSLVQEGLLLSAAASLLAGVLAIVLLDGFAVKFTMGAFRLRVDEWTLLLGCSSGLLLGVLGTLPPAIKALRTEVATGLKAV